MEFKMTLLVDGNNLVNAAFFVAQAKADQINTEEIQKNTIGIFMSQINRLKRELKSDNVYIAWDGRYGAQWRKEVLPEYKSGRNKEGKEFLFSSLDYCREIESHNNFHHDDYEADDIIYALCRAIDDEKVICSADKDFIQIVQEGLANKLYNPISKQFREIPEICAITRSAICGGDDSLKGVPQKGEAFLKKFVKRQARLTEQEWEIYEKHRLVFGLKYNPYKEEILKFVQEKLTNM